MSPINLRIQGSFINLGSLSYLKTSIRNAYKSTIKNYKQIRFRFSNWIFTITPLMVFSVSHTIGEQPKLDA